MRRFLPHIDISLKVETGNRSRNIAGTIGIKAADANDTNIFRAVKFGWGGGRDFRHFNGRFCNDKRHRAKSLKMGAG
jgi:hypothetical protein